jgi:hypothetical protein
MAYLVGDCGSQQALENKDGNRNRCRVSSHHHHQDTKPEAAPTTRDQERDMVTEQQWLNDEMECRRICIKDS